MNHRRLQRVLFRMQHDPEFARRLLARDPEALSSAQLGERELALLARADPAAIAADAEGKRRAQLLRNLGSELPLACAVGPRGDGSPTWLEGFPASTWFHDAIMANRSLPLALAEWATTQARAAEPAFRALLALETALVRARREELSDPPVGPGQLVRSARARLVPLPEGTFAYAAEVRVALDRAERPPCRALDAKATETVLVLAHPREATSAPKATSGLASVRVEPLQPLVAHFLARAECPLDAAALREFARNHELDPTELASVIEEFQSEGVLLAGPAPRPHEAGGASA